MHGDDTAKWDIERTAKAIRDGDRVALARTITLVESAKPEDQASAEALLDRLCSPPPAKPSGSASAACPAPVNRR